MLLPCRSRIIYRSLRCCCRSSLILRQYRYSLLSSCPYFPFSVNSFRSTPLIPSFYCHLSIDLSSCYCCDGPHMISGPLFSLTTLGPFFYRCNWGAIVHINLFFVMAPRDLYYPPVSSNSELPATSLFVSVEKRRRKKDAQGQIRWAEATACQGWIVPEHELMYDQFPSSSNSTSSSSNLSAVNLHQACPLKP